MDIDEVFQHIGELGHTQKKLFVMLSVPMMWTAFHVLVINFIGSDPGWSCSVASPNTESNCSDISEACVGYSQPLSVLVTDQEEKCRYYEKGDCILEFNTMYTSIVTEWELVCGRSSYPNLSQSAFFLGLMTGAWPLGALADKYGRKRTLFLALLGCVLTGVGYGLAADFLTFAVFRFIFGVAKQAVTVISFSLLFEVVGPSKRSFIGLFSPAFFSLGICLLVALAYYIHNWRTLCLFISLVGLGYIPLWKWIPESPRWLLVQGRETEAKAVLAAIAQGNGSVMVSTRLRKPPGQDSSENSPSLVDLFRGEEIRRRTLILLVAWFTNSVLYYGLSLGASSLGGGRYLSLLLSGLVELPGLCASYFLLNRLGRRLSHGGFLMLTGICCVAWTLGHWAGWRESLTFSIALLGKCSVATSFAVIYLFTAELFPTQVRSLGIGVVNIASRLGGILSPLILLTSVVSVGMPMLVMGSLGLLAGFVTLSLPETLGQSLPETLEDLK